MNPAQIHLALNHIPPLGTLFGLLLLVAGLWRRSRDVQLAGLVTLVVAGLVTIPTFLSGEPSEPVVERYPGVRSAAIEEHEDAAAFGLVSALASGAIALGILLFARAGTPPGGRWYWAALAVSLFTFAVMLRISHLGGLIRHVELGTVTSGGSEEHDD